VLRPAHLALSVLQAQHCSRDETRSRLGPPNLPGFGASAPNHTSFRNRAAVGRERVPEQMRGARDKGKGRAAVLSSED